MPTFTTPDGVKLNYLESGSGQPALVMVHGLCSNARHWDAQARAFGRRHRVIRPDLRGHGASEAPARGYSIRRFAEDVAALTRARRVRGAVILGHSMGGLVAVEAARRHRDLFKALVLVDMPAGVGGLSSAQARQSPLAQSMVNGAWPDAVEQLYARFFTNTRDKRLAGRITKDAGRTRQAAAAASTVALVRYALPAAAKQVKQPALYIAASQGNARWDALREHIPQVQFARVVGAGHFLQLEAPDQCNAMIREFIARL